MIRLELIPFLLFALCLCLVSKLSHCSVSNGEAKHHISDQNIIHRKVQQSVNKLTKMWQFSPRAHFSKKQLQTVQTDDKFINHTALPYNNEGTMNSVSVLYICRGLLKGLLKQLGPINYIGANHR
jgi:hypothetical protein